MTTKQRNFQNFLKHNKKRALNIVTIFFAVILMLTTFFVTRGEPHTSELAFIEYSTLGKTAGSVIPASCESGIDHGASKYCGWGVSVGACELCPPQSCWDFSGTRDAGACTDPYEGSNIWRDYYSCGDNPYAVAAYTHSVQESACTLKAPTCSDYSEDVMNWDCPAPQWSGDGDWSRNNYVCDSPYGTAQLSSTEHLRGCTENPQTCFPSSDTESRSCPATFIGDETWQTDYTCANNWASPAAGTPYKIAETCSCPSGHVLSGGSCVCTNGAIYGACDTCPNGTTFIGGTCQAQIWTDYCTGGSDPFGNNWQVWEYDNGDVPTYRFTGTYCDPNPSIDASPSNLSWNTASTITWSSSNTASCTASNGWSGSKSSSGSQSTGNLTANATYAITCTNAYGDTSPLMSASVTTCPFATPTWTGLACVGPTGDITPNSCTIPIGSGSCSMNVAWSTTNPPGVVEVRRNYDAGSVLATGASGNNSYVFPYSATPYTLDLYDDHRNVLLDSASFSATCASGGFDTVSDTCVNPSVTSVAVSGQYYSSPGNIRLVCANSNTYSVTNADSGIIISSGVYSGPVDIPVITTGNYAMRCGHGDYFSNATLRFYNSPPPPNPIVSLTVNPRTISKNADTVLRWDVTFPTTTCAFSAKSVCVNDRCTTEQTAVATAIATKLNTENSDIGDPNGSRLIRTAIRTITAGHTDTDWKSLGQKTLKIANTVDITLSCGVGSTATARAQVTTSNEQ